MNLYRFQFYRDYRLLAIALFADSEQSAKEELCSILGESCLDQLEYYDVF